MLADFETYILKNSLRESKLLKQLREKTLTAVDYAHMMSPPSQMQFLQLIMRLIGARRAIEIGVFTGYGTLAIAEALPSDGQLIACDHNHTWPTVGQPFWNEAGVIDKIDLRIAPALETLDELLVADVESFDFIYIDADKINYKHYFERGLKLLRKNGLMVFDNTLTVSCGTVLKVENPTTRFIDEFNKFLHHDERVDISLLAEGSGITLARKR